MEHREPVLRFRVTPSLMARIEREAQSREVKVHEVARLAIVEGLRVLFGDRTATDDPPAQAA